MDDTSQTVSLEQWPLNPECYVPPGQDPANCHRILAEISPDLFQITGGGVRMYRDCSPQKGIEFHFVSSEMLESTTWDNSTDNIPEGQGMVFWIQPHFSWGQLGITENAFRRLLADHRVFTPLLDIVYGFGAKTNDHQRFRDFVHLHHHTIQDFEFCYNIQYYELNGRGRGNPWSLRQTGVYQQMLTTRYTWIVISVSDYLQARFGEFFGTYSGTKAGYCVGRVLLGHLIILSMTTRNWDAYIECLRQKILSFEYKTVSSSIDPKLSDAPDLILSGVPKANALCSTIAISKTILNSQTTFLLALQKLHTKVSGKGTKACSCHIASAIQLKHMEIRNHLKAVDLMGKRAERLPHTISTILSTRAQTKLHATLTQIQVQVHGTLCKTLEASNDVKDLVQVTTSGHKDSKTIKSLAEIATVFLPLSFLASLFDTDILYSASAGGLYAAIVIPLVLLTVLVIVLLERRAI